MYDVHYRDELSLILELISKITDQTYPPYLSRTRREIQDPAQGLWIHCGQQAWNHGRKWPYHTDRYTAVLPPKAPVPQAYAWPVDKMECMIMCHGGVGSGMLIRKLLALHLLDYGASVVRILSPDQPLAVYRKELP